MLRPICGTMLGYSFLWVWVCACQRIPLSVLAWNHTLRSRKRTREGRSQREQKKPNDRTGQSAGESCQQKSVEADGEKKATAGTCGSRGRVDQREWMSQHSWWLCGDFARIHAPDSPQIQGKLHKSVTNFSHLVLGANPSPCLFVLFPPLSRLCMLCFVCR